MAAESDCTCDVIRLETKVVSSKVATVLSTTETVTPGPAKVSKPTDPCDTTLATVFRAKEEAKAPDAAPVAEEFVGTFGECAVVVAVFGAASGDSSLAFVATPQRRSLSASFEDG